MVKKLQKTDYFFAAAMLAILSMHLLCIFSPDHFADESFYPTIPLRLMNGDSLISDEWHLTQFSSVFLYLPTRLWVEIKGSADGIILYLRFLYLSIHSGVSIWLYKHFRAYGIPAVAAALLFYSQVPLRFLSANYHSLLALFLLFLTISLHVAVYATRLNALFIPYTYLSVLYGKPRQSTLTREKEYRTSNSTRFAKETSFRENFSIKRRFGEFLPE